MTGMSSRTVGIIDSGLGIVGSFGANFTSASKDAQWTNLRFNSLSSHW